MKCLQGIKAVEIRSKGSSDPALSEGRGSLLPSTGCGFSPWQGLIHPQECEICLSPISSEILLRSHVHGPVESLQFIHPGCCESCCGHTMPGSCLHSALLPKCCFLHPAQSHTGVSSTALVHRPDVGSLDQPPGCNHWGCIQTGMLFCRR